MNYDDLYKTLNERVSVFVKPAVVGQQPVLVTNQPKKANPYMYTVIGLVVFMIVLAIARPGFIMTMSVDEEDTPPVINWTKLLLVMMVVSGGSFGAVYYFRTK